MKAYIINVAVEDIMFPFPAVISYCSVCQESVSLPIISDKREIFPDNCPHCGREFINSKMIIEEFKSTKDVIFKIMYGNGLEKEK